MRGKGEGLGEHRARRRESYGSETQLSLIVLSLFGQDGGGGGGLGYGPWLGQGDLTSCEAVHAGEGLLEEAGLCAWVSLLGAPRSASTVNVKF